MNSNGFQQILKCILISILSVNHSNERIDPILLNQNRNCQGLRLLKKKYQKDQKNPWIKKLKKLEFQNEQTKQVEELIHKALIQDVNQVCTINLTDNSVSDKNSMLTWIR